MPQHTDPLNIQEILAEERIAIGLDPSGPRSSSALCISGGGIRSATFALGAIQGLADAGVLESFDYMSTVSGGGYIGAWLTAWKNRSGSLSAIIPKLRSSATPPLPTQSDPLGHLRAYNSYLSPRRGLLSADVWTLASTVIQNIVLNWLVLIPLLMSALMVPRIFFSLAFRSIRTPHDVPAVLSLPIRIGCGVLLAIAVLNTMRYLPGIGGRDNSERNFLWNCLAPLVSAVLLFLLYDAWYDPSAYGPASPSLLQLFASITGSCLAGWILFALFFAKELNLRIAVLGIALLPTGLALSAAAWELVNVVFPGLLPNGNPWAWYVTIGPALLLAALLGAGMLFVGLSSSALGDDDREWLSRGAAWILIFMVCWTAGVGLVLLGSAWLTKSLINADRVIDSSIAAAGGLLGWLCSAAAFSLRYLPANGGNPQENRKGDSTLKAIAAPMAGSLFVVFLLAMLTAVTTALLQYRLNTSSDDVLDKTPFLLATGAAAVFYAAGWIAARFININKFSLHAMYRDRLIRAYLGASNTAAHADNFIGFNQSDNVWMADLDPHLRPFHIVNITLNLVGGKRLAWQQRKAESFTVSPLHSGCANLAYRPSSQYGGKKGISLGTAITISGAAASPNMGYHSSGLLTFVMTLFNARLGAWLGNPGSAGEKTWKLNGPKSAIGSLINESFGLTDDQSDYVYLSDGGHFENLGLYEMVLRGCTRIVVLDSGCDPEFNYEDLGNALRKIRIDYGIPIDFADKYTDPLRKKEKRCAVATIRYSAVDSSKPDGLLLYIKPMILGNEPPDVLSYHSAHPAFPHEGTGNQWYNESQTESYRMLGIHTIHEIFGDWKGTGDLDALFTQARNAYLAPAAVRAAAGGALPG